MLAAQRAIVGAVQSPLTESRGVDQAGLLNFAAVRQLKGEPLYELLTLFTNGDVQQVRAFFAANAALMEQVGLDFAQSLENTRLLCVCALAASARELEYAAIATARGVAEGEGELERGQHWAAEVCVLCLSVLCYRDLEKVVL